MPDNFELDNISYPIDEVDELRVDDWDETEVLDIDWYEPTDLSDNDLYRGTI